MLNSSTKIKKYFCSLKTPYASDSNWFWKFFRNRERKLFCDLVQNINITNCLDLGAGSCEYSKMLLQMGAKHSVCVDFSSSLMSEVHDSNITKIFRNVETFEANKKYDLILCLGILEFLDHPKEFMLKLKKFLKPTGKVIILLPLSKTGSFLYAFIYLLKGILIRTLTLKKISIFLIQNDFQLEKTATNNIFSGFAIYSIKKTNHKMKMKRILFLVNGYGLGNSTRIHGIIQHIKTNCEMDVFAYGNSLEYFKQLPGIQNIFEGYPMEYGLKNGEIDFFATTGKIFKNLKAIYKSRKYLKDIIKSHHYDLIISDSNFSPVFLKNRPKLISINNANVIIKRALKIKKKGYYIQFFTELGDFIYNSLVPDLVISPFFEPCKSTKKIRHTPIIVRKEFKRPCQNLKRHHVLVMTGGTGTLNKGLSINHNRDNYDLSVLGDQIKISGKAKRENKTFNVSRLMSQSTILVINGGFSSISESLALAKPVIVIPLKGHIEQKINALWVQEKHFGLMSSWRNLESSIIHIKENYTHFKKALLTYDYLNGAEQVASLISKELENDTMC